MTEGDCRPAPEQEPDYRTAQTAADVTPGTCRRCAASNADRIAAAIAGHCGSITSVWVHVALFTAWIAYNSLHPYPFTFLT